MVIGCPAFETLEQVNRYTTASFKPPLFCITRRLARALAAAAFPQLGLAALAQRTTSGQGTARSLPVALETVGSTDFEIKIIPFVLF
jgi:hypothetical protein